MEIKVLTETHYIGAFGRKFSSEREAKESFIIHEILETVDPDNKKRYDRNDNFTAYDAVKEIVKNKDRIISILCKL